MTFPVLADVAASVTYLKRDPMGTLREGNGETVVILNRNEPAFYAVFPKLYDAMREMIDHMSLVDTLRARRDEPSIEEDINELVQQGSIP